MNVTKVDWDSEFFGYPIGKISINESFSEKDFLSLKNKSKAFKVVYVFSNEPLPILEPYLQDVKVMFHKKLVEPIPFESDIIEFDSNIHSYLEIEDLALKAGVFSRFKLDKNFTNNEYEKLYKEWMSKSISKKLADHIFVKIVEKKMMGFISMRFIDENTSEIELIAVDFEYRGKGLALKFLNHCDATSLNKGRDIMAVPTQETNTPAVNLYFKAGFKVKNKTYTYHIWNL